jgi:hypothetical protein
MDSLSHVPTWYVLIGLLWSVYQGIRGAVEHHLGRDYLEGADERQPKWKPWQRWLILYTHDFAFRFICTAAGFVALYLAIVIAGDVNNIRSLSAGTSVLLAFLFIIAIVGVGGQLHYVILMGNLPK